MCVTPGAIAPFQIDIFPTESAGFRRTGGN